MAKKKASKGSEGSTSLVPIQTGDQAKAAEVEVSLVKRAFNALPELIRNDDQSVAYADFMTKLQTATKSVDLKEKSITKHLNSAKKIVIDLFKPMKLGLKGYRVICDERLLEYRELLQAKADEERRREEEREAKRLAKLAANEAKKLKAAKDKEEKARIKAAYQGKAQQVRVETDAAMEMIEDEPPEAPGVSFRETWQFDILNIDEVPVDYLDRSVNRKDVMSEVDRQLEAGREEPEIRGLRIFKKAGTAVKGL